MGLGDFLGKIITAPIKIMVMPVRAIIDVVESDYDNPIKTITDSVEKQINDIVG